MPITARKLILILSGANFALIMPCVKFGLTEAALICLFGGGLGLFLSWKEPTSHE